MQWTFFTPLFLAASSLLVFGIIYQLVLAKLTHFNWQRSYLLMAICFSSGLPFMPNFSNWLSVLFANDALPQTILTAPWEFNLLPTTAKNIEFVGITTRTIDVMAILGGVLAIIYLSGVIIKWLFFIDKLSVIHQMIRSNPKEKVGEEWLVKLPENGTAFSFFHYIFLTQSLKALSQQEVNQIIAHEQIHSQQKHSLDIILVEIAEIFLWFHPVIYQFKNSLKDLHEYLVDQAMTQQKITKKTYAQLLIKLASPLTINSLTTGFNHKLIGRRITMLATTPSASYHKLKFLLMLPIITSLLLFSACFGETNQITPTAETPQTLALSEQNTNETTLKIGKITWVGNTIFSEKELNDALQLNEGDIFDKELLDKRLHWDGKGTDVSSLYLNKGYTYFKIEMEQAKKGNVLDLTFKLFEGVEVSIANVTISGNKTISTAELMAKIGIKEGDLFSRSKIIAAQRALLEMDKFDGEKIGINTPILPENNQLMNIEFSVVELK